MLWTWMTHMLAHHEVRFWHLWIWTRQVDPDLNVDALQHLQQFQVTFVIQNDVRCNTGP